MNRSQGNISILVMIFGLVLTVMIGGLAAFGAVENTNTRRDEASAQALAIAEAGVNFYRWVLAHNPEDFQAGTGEPGPYVFEYDVPGSGVVGSYSIEVTPPPEGSRVVTITSTGSTSEFPNLTRTIRARFGPEPLTRFSFLHNANVWFGQGLTVYGEVMSNGGIRFDGINESVVRSARETYTCGSETGCSPTQSRPGVWGAGGPQDLWEFPVPIADFDSILTDFNHMRQASQEHGVYLGPSTGHGYRIRFNQNGTFDVFRVNNAQNLRGWNVDTGSCQNLYQNISNQTLLGTYSTDERRIVYAEDTVWVDGTVNGSVTVVAARLPTTAFTTNMWITDSIQYSTYDGSDNLGLIAQNDIIFGRNLPNDFVINAALLAQQGKIFRHYYMNWSCSPSSAWAIRDSLTIYGTVISNQKSYWNYANSSGLLSGFHEREISYNQRSADIPPPYYPDMDHYRFLSWEEL